MAVVFSKLKSASDDLWNEWATQLALVMQDEDTEQSNYDKVLKEIFNVESSQRFGEKITGVTEFGNFEVVGEGDSAVADTYSQGYDKLIQHVSFMKEFTCTAEMAEDNRVLDMKRQAQHFIRAYKRSKLDYATAFLTAGAATFTYGNKTGLDATTGDGKALFATDHPTFKDKSATQSNVFTNAFGSDAKMLNRLANIGRNYKNDSGITMGYTFDTIIIPSNCWELEETVKKIIGSDGEVGSNNNDINTQRGKWKLIVNPLWEAAAGKNPYMIMSSEANKDMLGNVFYDRTDLIMKNDVDVHNHNLTWSGRARFSAGAGNWRHIIMGGADLGTTLE